MMTRTRADVYEAIDTERGYQDRQTQSADRPDMNPEMSMGDYLLAMEENLHLARHLWYREGTPYTNTMDHVRKVAGLSVAAGEQFGMPRRVG